MFKRLKETILEIIQQADLILLGPVSYTHLFSGETVSGLLFPRPNNACALPASSSDAIRTKAMPRFMRIFMIKTSCQFGYTVLIQR